MNKHKSLTSRLACSLFIALGLISFKAVCADSTLQTSSEDVVRAQLLARDYTTLSASNPAKIANLPFKEGQTFKKGEVLVSYDCRLENAQANYAQAEAKAAKKQLNSMKQLNSYNAISTLELDNSTAKLELANAKLKIEQVKVQDCTEKAPFDGVISALYVHQHQRVKVGDPIMEILNPNNIDIQMRIPSKWLTKVKVGTPFTLVVDENGTIIRAKITRISGLVDSVSQTVMVYSETENTKSDVLPGMSGSVTFD